MENATKALLIAASVLIVILLIAFGMKIFNSTSGTADEVDGVMQTTEMTMFNNKFLAYSGIQSGSQVKALANLVIAHNANNSRKVDLNGTTNPNTILTAISSVNTSARYNITITDTEDDGYIDNILISF